MYFFLLATWLAILPQVLTFLELRNFADWLSIVMRVSTEFVFHHFPFRGNFLGTLRLYLGEVFLSGLLRSDIQIVLRQLLIDIVLVGDVRRLDRVLGGNTWRRALAQRLHRLDEAWSLSFKFFVRFLRSHSAHRNFCSL